MRFSVILLVAFYALTAQAAFDVRVNPKPNRSFSVESGDKIILDGKEDIFLGRTISQDYTMRELMVYDTEAKRIHALPLSEVRMHDASGVQIETDRLFPIVRSEEQEGETCMAFTMYNSIRQMDYLTRGANKKIHEALSTESKRQHFMVKMLSDYYLTEHAYDAKVLGYLSDTYDVNIYRLDRKQLGIPGVRNEILRNLAQHDPVLITFDVPKFMSETPYDILVHATGKIEPRELWTPKAEGTMSFGGHAVLATGLITDAEGVQWMIMVDPNWDLPRMWNIDELQKLVGGGIQAWVYDNTPNGPRFGLVR